MPPVDFGRPPSKLTDAVSIKRDRKERSAENVDLNADQPTYARKRQIKRELVRCETRFPPPHPLAREMMPTKLCRLINGRPRSAGWRMHRTRARKGSRGGGVPRVPRAVTLTAGVPLKTAVLKVYGRDGVS